MTSDLAVAPAGGRRRRAILAAIGYLIVAAFALAFLPPIIALAIFVVGPGLAAGMAAGQPFERETYVANGFVVSLASGLLSAIWIGANGPRTDAPPAGIAVGAVVSFVLLSSVGMLSCWAWQRFFGRERAARPTVIRSHGLDDDDDDEVPWRRKG